MTTYNVTYSYKQGLYFTSRRPFTLFCAGVGTGKSFIGAEKAKRYTEDYPSAIGFIGANTHKQLTQTTLKTFFKRLDQLNISYVFNKRPPRSWRVKSKFPTHEGIITRRNGAQIWTRPLTNYDDIRGQELGWAWLDETRDTKCEAFKVLMGRMRDKNGPRSIDITTTPNGFDWLYDSFAGDKILKDSLLIQASSDENKDNLPDGYIEMMLDGYDDQFAKQEIGGEFVNMGEGQCYYSFNRNKNVSSEAQDDGYSKIIVGMDFNVSPMTAVVGRLQGAALIWFDEITMNRANTEDMANEITNRYTNWRQRQIKIYPDATGGAGKTASRGNYRSDHAILKQIFGHESVHGAKSNPRQRDRITAVNAKFHHCDMVLNPKMKKTISSLEKTKYKDGSKFEIDKKADCEHWSDALGYPVFRLFPIKDNHKSGQASWTKAA